MGYFDKMAESAFKETDDGSVIYYPNGIMGKGRVVPNEDVREKLYRFQKNMHRYLIFFGIPYGWLMGISRSFSAITISPLIAFVVLMYSRQFWLVHKLPKHPSRMRLKEAMTKGSKALPNGYYWALGTFSLLALVYAMTLPYQLGKTSMPVMELVALLGGSSLLVLGIAIFMYRLKNGN